MNDERIADLRSRIHTSVDDHLRERMITFFIDADAGTTALQQAQPPRDFKAEYKRYLRTATWRKVIRPRILRRDEYRCRRCGGTADRVHHRSYTPEVKAGDCDEQLASVCEGCHDVIEYDESGRERSSEGIGSHIASAEARHLLSSAEV